MLSPILILINLYIAASRAEDIPIYTRGPVPNWFLPDVARENGITFLGSHARLRVAMDKVIRLIIDHQSCDPALDAV